MKEYGRVEWFDRKLGYGFISRREKPDIFAHYSEIEAPGVERRFLSPGDVVEFEPKPTRHGDRTKWQATQIIVVNAGGLDEAVS